MWLKNIVVYSFTQPFSLPEDLDAQLEAYRFKKAEKQQLASFGFISPFGSDSEVLSHAPVGNVLLAAKKEEKIIPPAAVREVLEEKAEAYEQEHGRPMPRKERAALKEDIVHQMMATAFTRSATTLAYIDLKAQRLVVAASTSVAAEDFNALLRGALGSLPVRPWLSDVNAEVMFTGMLQDTANLPQSWELGSEATLVGRGDEASVTVHRKQDLTNGEVKASLEHGKTCTKINLLWPDYASFTLTSDLAIKSIKYSDALMDTDDGAENDKYAQMDADFILVSQTLNAIMDTLEAHASNKEQAA